MDWLNPRPKSRQVRLRAMMESGQLVDEVAEIVQTQVIAHKARASIRNRDPVPLYQLKEENRHPVWKENLLVETGLSPLPGMDSSYILEDSQNLWKGIRHGSVEIDGESKFRANLVAVVVNVAAVLIFFGFAWLSGIKVGADSQAEASVQQETTKEEFGHGFVDQVEGTAGQTTGGTGTAGVGGDTGRSPQEPVESGPPGDSGGGDAPSTRGPTRTGP